MNKMKRLLIYLLPVMLWASCAEAPHELDRPWDKGGLETGCYRNVFAELGYDEADIEARVQAVFDEVFRGPGKVYFEVGDSMGYISDIKNHDVRTEGMSYGMMIAVQRGEKDIFDRLWRWAKTYMQHADGPLKGYFAWSCNTDGTHRAEGPASDGELYFVTSLIFAHNLWGSQGDIHYNGEMKVVALRHSVGLVSTLAAVTLAADNDHAREFVERLWTSENKPYEDGYFDAYYDGLLRLFAFLHLSGNYRVIPPVK